MGRWIFSDGVWGEPLHISDGGREMLDAPCRPCSPPPSMKRLVCEGPPTQLSSYEVDISVPYINKFSQWMHPQTQKPTEKITVSECIDPYKKKEL